MDEIERLIASLYTADARAAGSRLVELGAAAVEALLVVLSGQHKTPDLTPLDILASAPDILAARERAAYLLGDIGDRRAIEPLIAAFARESDRYVRLAVVRALGRIGHARAIEPLIAALEIPAWTPDYGCIVDDLARIGGERAVEPLLRVAQSTEYTYGGAARAVRALLDFQADPRVLDGLIGALRLNAEISTVEAVIEVLAEIGDPRGARALLALVNTMLQLPPERWDEREENLSETDQGAIFHVLKAQLRQAVRALQCIGDAETLAALDPARRAAPDYLSGF